MMLFRNFRIRRHLCGLTCEDTADTLIVFPHGVRNYYCPAHAGARLYWAQETNPGTHKVFKDTGARECL